VANKIGQSVEFLKRINEIAHLLEEKQKLEMAKIKEEVDKIIDIVFAEKMN
jgi:hypothetical protein